MKRFLARWRRRRQLRKSAASIERHVTDLENTLKLSQELIDKVAGSLDQLKRSVMDLEETQRRYALENDSLRSELTVLKEVTIPGLVSANNLVLQRIEADIAVQVKRQVGSGTQ